MKSLPVRGFFAIVLLMLASYATMAQSTKSTTSKTSKETKMKLFVIERELPNAGNLTQADLKGIAQKSCGVIKDMGPKIEWVNSYVTANKIYCIYRAENADLVREHAKKGGFPCNTVSEVANTFGPATATAK